MTLCTLHYKPRVVFDKRDLGLKRYALSYLSKNGIQLDKCNHAISDICSVGCLALSYNSSKLDCEFSANE